jgi:hypothetical protein
MLKKAHFLNKNTRRRMQTKEITLECALNSSVMLALDYHKKGNQVNLILTVSDIPLFRILSRFRVGRG